MSGRGFYVIGDNISYSLSPEIHKMIGDLAGFSYKYSIKNVKPEKIDVFLMGKKYSGLNVTVPYKKIAAGICDELSECAQVTGSVNTVKNNRGILSGYNTDVAGFLKASELAGFDYSGKKVLLLGTGGAACGIKYALKLANVSEVRMISRKGEAPFNYDCIGEHYDVDFVVNATPVGMTGHGEGIAPISLEGFYNLSGVFDLIYSPRETVLLADAAEKKIPCVNGLSMLVSQAVYAAEIFTDKIPDKNYIISEILKKMSI